MPVLKVRKQRFQVVVLLTEEEAERFEICAERLGTKTAAETFRGILRASVLGNK